ncbi:A2ML1 protein, partial [Polypterus senegalus]|nr:A2ML1 protein [Polypterus senegalus]
METENLTLLEEKVKEKDLYKCIKFQVPQVNDEFVGSIEVRLKGKTFEIVNEKKVLISSLTPMSFIQTDKPIYKPGQTGDPRSNRIGQWLNISSNGGIVDLSYPTTPEAPLGKYSLKLWKEDGKKIDQTFEVKEYDVKLEEGGLLKFTNVLINVDFEETDSVYKGGIPFKGKIKVTKPDSSPLTKENVYLYMAWDAQNETLTLETDSNGYAVFSLDTSSWGNSTINLRAYYKYEPEPYVDGFIFPAYGNSYLTVNPFYSKSKSFLKIQETNEVLTCETEAKVVIRYIIEMDELEEGSEFLDFYYHVELKFSSSSELPGDDTKLHLQAKPGSLCSVSAVDKSVLLLDSSKQLTANSVYSRLPVQLMSGYNYQAYDYEPYPCENHVLRTLQKRSMYYPMYSSANDVFNVFQGIGLKLLTNSDVKKPIICSPIVYYSRTLAKEDISSDAIQEMAVPFSIGAGMSGPGPQPVKETIRKFFPETWIWDLVSVGETGTLDIPKTVPDTITEWQADAFCTSPQGFGLAPSVGLTAFQPFFVELTLPYSVVRGEEFKLKASVFNYMSQCIMVKVTPAESSEYQLKECEGCEYKSCLCPDETKIFHWTLIPKALGEVNVTVRAEALSTEDLCGNEAAVLPETGRADVVIKKLLVEVKGVLQSTAENALLCPHGEPEITSISLHLPDVFIDGSAKALVSVLGDVMGRAMQNIDQLLAMPYGCGEQNMLLFAPNIYIMRYLEATSQMTQQIKAKAINFMESGYQRELNYKHTDGSYSAFGNSDESGNTWLTAFVMKSFGSASRFIYVNPVDISDAKKWLGLHQLNNGCFMNGGVNDEISLTAYIATALLELDTPFTDSILKNSLACLRSSLDNVTDIYTKVLLSYMFTLAKDEEARSSMLSYLDQAAIKTDGFLHWQRAGTNNNELSVQVEMTSYVLLALLSGPPLPGFDINYASKIVQWLVHQQNSQGGFSSTQDTVVALQALAPYAAQVFKPEGSSTVTISSAKGFQTQFHVDQINRLLYQEKVLQEVPGEYTIETNGNMCAFVQYNIPPPPDFTTFSISAEAQGNCNISEKNSLNVKIVVSYNGNRQRTNMVIINIKLLSGYSVNKFSLAMIKYMSSVRRIDQDNGYIDIYIEELVPKEPMTFTLTIEEEIPVKNIKPATVKIYDYYQPNDHAESEYKSPCSTARLVKTTHSNAPLPASVAFERQLLLQNLFLAQEEIYMVTIPQIIHGGTMEKICAHLLQPNETISFTVSLLMERENLTLLEEKIKEKDFYKCIEFRVPMSNEFVGHIEVRLSGKSFEVENKKKVLITPIRSMTFIQTDKPIYKPGQTVLPKYEVVIKLPETVTIEDTELKVQVCGKYTYGKPVVGSVKLSFCRKTSYYQFTRGEKRDICQMFIIMVLYSKQVLLQNSLMFWLMSNLRIHQTHTNKESLSKENKSFVKIQDLNEELECETEAKIITDYIIKRDELEEGATFVEFFYQVVAKGGIAVHGRLQTQLKDGEEGSFDFTFPVTSNVSPSAQVLIYTILPSGEIIADSNDFKVKKCFKNKVELRFSSPHELPGGDTNLHLQAKPGSLCSVRSVDKSVLLMDSSHELTADVSLGLKLLTNSDVKKPVTCHAYDTVMRLSSVPVNSPPRLGMAGGPMPNLVKETVRKFFPETWIWNLISVGETGVVDLPQTVPDTITEWQADAFCTSPEGFGLAHPIGLTAFQPFFVELTLPYSVVRGEAFQLKASVFNYLSQCIVVKVSPAESSQYNLEPCEGCLYKSCVCADESKVFRWTFTAKALGEVNVTVRAEALNTEELCGNEVVAFPDHGHADTVIRKLLVEKTTAINALLCPKDEHTESKTFSLELPEVFVEGSAKASVSVLGDVMGRAMQNLDKLLAMPFGCGEQNMVLFAPNIYILRYLEATGQMTEQIKAKAIQFMESGYQRELNYKHTDGSYSAFGNSDESGNTWLTAFVMKSFGSARRFIFIDPAHISDAKKWLGRHQLENGCFQNVGKLFHSGMKGGINDEISLTAYITTALLELETPLSDSILNNSLSCLRSSLSNVTDVYTKILLSYMFTLARDEEARNSLLSFLEKVAVKEDGFLHWERSGSGEKINSVQVEMTSYVLLSLLSGPPLPEFDLTYTSSIVQWLVRQQNSYGGFSSTQLALEYNVPPPPDFSIFNITAEAEGKCNSSEKNMLHLKIVVGYNGNRDRTNMVIVNVKLLSGYHVDMVSISMLRHNPLVKRIDKDKGYIDIYLEEQTSVRNRIYMVTIPHHIHGGTVEKVCAHLLQPNETISFTIDLLMERENLTLLEEKIKEKDFYKCIEFQVPMSNEFLGHIKVRLRGKSFEVENKKKVLITPIQSMTFIQTDKPIYKPGQTGTCLDPRSNRIGQWLNISTNNGIVDLSYPTTSEAPLGVYTLRAWQEQGFSLQEQFKVKEYAILHLIFYNPHPVSASEINLIKVKQADSSPVANEQVFLDISRSGIAEIQVLNTDGNGAAFFSLNTSSWGNDIINLQAYYKKDKETFTHGLISPRYNIAFLFLKPFYSKSKSFVKIQDLNGELECETEAKIITDYIIKRDELQEGATFVEFFYQVVAKGGIAISGRLQTHLKDGEAGVGGAVFPGSQPDFAKETIRKFFPETWIWNLISVGETGVIDLPQTVPDTITEWQADAFCTSPEGFGLAHPIGLTAFQPFFVELTLPYSVVRGEAFQLKASVKVSPAESSQYNLEPCEGCEYKSCVCADESKVFRWTFTAKALDEFIESKTFSLELPEVFVDGSAKASVSVLGDVMGRAMQNMDKLLAMPFGCGEQNMVLFAPNIYILRYLEATGQMTEQIKAKAIRFMESGYQRELNYKHTDGSYSAFGNSDASGNTWLTAFVMKSFGSARRFVFIDPAHISDAKKWLGRHQLENGCFQNVGKLFHSGMKGGINDEISLTAYITTALLELETPLSDSILNNSLSCLRSSLSNVTDVYTKILLSYMFTLARDEEARSSLLSFLDKVAVKEDSFIHWERSGSSEKINSVQVEMTSYVLLSLLSGLPLPQFDLAYASSIVQWLVRQQNSNGGFSSTQLALEYNVPPPPDFSIFNITAEAEGQCNSNEKNMLHLKIVVGYNGNRDRTNMVIVNVKLLSGYHVDMLSISRLRHNPLVKRIDKDKGYIDIYLEELVERKPLTLHFRIQEEIAVKNLKPATVRIYDYYQTNDHAEAEYRSPCTTVFEVSEGINYFLPNPEVSPLPNGSQCKAKEIYMVTIPHRIHGGTKEKVCAHLLQPNETISFTINLKMERRNLILLEEDIKEKDFYKCIEFQDTLWRSGKQSFLNAQVPMSNEFVGHIEVRLRGKSFEAENKKKVLITPIRSMTFIQTDKPIYKPGQTVKILDSSNNQLQILTDKSGCATQVVELEGYALNSTGYESSFTADAELTEVGTGIPATEIENVMLTNISTFLKTEKGQRYELRMLMLANHCKSSKQVMQTTESRSSDTMNSNQIKVNQAESSPVANEQVFLDISQSGIRETQVLNTEGNGVAFFSLNTSSWYYSTVRLKAYYKKDNETYTYGLVSPSYHSADLIIKPFYSISKSFVKIQDINGELECETEAKIITDYIIKRDELEEGATFVEFFYQVSSQKILM